MMNQGRKRNGRCRAVCILADCASLAVEFGFRFAASEPNLEAISIIVNFEGNRKSANLSNARVEATKTELNPISGLLVD